MAIILYEVLLVFYSCLNDDMETATFGHTVLLATLHYRLNDGGPTPRFNCMLNILLLLQSQCFIFF